MPVRLQVGEKQVQAAEVQVAAEDMTDRFCLVCNDGDLSVLGLIAEGTTPPTQRPLRLEAPILSRMRSEVTSRSNWAKDNKTLRVSLPIEVVVLNC